MNKTTQADTSARLVYDIVFSVQNNPELQYCCFAALLIVLVVKMAAKVQKNKFDDISLLQSSK